MIGGTWGVIVMGLLKHPADLALSWCVTNQVCKHPPAVYLFGFLTAR